MCDYCDCRTRPLLAELGAEHVDIGAAVSRLRTAEPGDDRRARADELRVALGAHSRREEAALYPELDRAGVRTAHMEAEHAQLDAVLGEVAAGGDVRWAEVGAALDELAGHIHREEYDLFPAAHQVLDDAAWDRIDAARPEG